VAPHGLAAAQALDPRGGHVFLTELVEHEAAGHTCDVGRGGIAQQRRRQDDVVDGAAEHLPFPGQRAVDQQEVRPLRHQPDIELAHPAGPADPAEIGVEHQQRDHPGPEDRHRVPHQADHADQLVGPAVLVDRCDHSERRAEAGADEDGEGGELDGGRQHPGDILQHRLAGADRSAEVQRHHVAQVKQELLPHGLV